MERQDFINRITEIGSCEDDVQRRELLTQLSEEASKDYERLETLTQTNATLMDDKEKLLSANMELFKRIGVDKDADERKKDETGVDGKEKPKRSFNDLFNEKGGLK